MISFTICIRLQYHYGNQTKEDVVGDVCGLRAREANCMHALVGKFQGNRPLGRTLYKRLYKIEHWQAGKLIYLAEDK